MKHVPFAAALLVLAGLALGFVLGRAEPPDASLFGPQMALPAALAPLSAPEGTLALGGTVHHAGGAAAEDVLVTLVRDGNDPAQTEPLYHAYTDHAGRFELARLAPGRYTVVLDHRSAPPTTLELRLPLDASAVDGAGNGGGAGAVRWELAAPLPPLEVLPEIARGALAGRVVAPAELGARDLAGFEVVLAPAEGTPPLAGAAVLRVPTDAEGRFALADVVAAQYRAEVLPPWARGGSWPVLARGTARVTADARAELELALEVGALAGELAEASGRPLAGAVVAVEALEAPDAIGAPQLWPPETSDGEGRYRVELLPPGRYRVHVRAGAAASDVEVRVERGSVTRVPPSRMDVRAGGAPGG